jgi:pimeloyl-ACP methyl ester carboxylesterase
VRSKHEDALPLVVCHGWPGSFIEQMKIVDLLTDPTAHGGSASDAFHVVIPNMPGYGFSGKPTETGWGPERIGRAWVELMKRLGYTQFVASGGDWGGIVVDVMGRGASSPPEPVSPELLGIHSTFPAVFPAAIEKAIQTGGELPSDLSAAEQRAIETLASAYGYAGQAGWRATRRRCSDWLTHPSPWRPG